MQKVKRILFSLTVFGIIVTGCASTAGSSHGDGVVDQSSPHGSDTKIYMAESVMTAGVANVAEGGKAYGAANVTEASKISGSATVAEGGKASGSANVKTFGAAGDGVTDDTEAIRTAIAAGGGEVLFPGGSYRITETIEIDLSEHGPRSLRGAGSSARVIMAGEGPAFRFVGSHQGSAFPDSFEPHVWERERMPTVSGLEIVGDHSEANGLEFYRTMQVVVHSVLIRQVHHGIHLPERNRNVIISDSHIYDNSGYGIFLDDLSLHQVNITGNHISYNNLGGIKVSGQSDIRNFQITGNDIEYNYGEESLEVVSEPGAADIWIDTSQGGSVREGAISGNTIQARPSRGGANIRFTGTPGDSQKIGLWSITGNHISSQMINIHLDHVQGISITGNTFIRGYARHVVVENSRNVILSANVFDNNSEYAHDEEYVSGGIDITGSSNLIVSDNIVDGIGRESGAITVTDSREITLQGNRVSNPRYRGVQINNSPQIQVSGNRVFTDRESPDLLSSIETNGDCEGTLIYHNSLVTGSEGDIDDRGTGVTATGNFRTDLVE